MTNITADNISYTNDKLFIVVNTSSYGTFVTDYINYAFNIIGIDIPKLYEYEYDAIERSLCESNIIDINNFSSDYNITKRSLIIKRYLELNKIDNIYDIELAETLDKNLYLYITIHFTKPIDSKFVDKVIMKNKLSK